MPRIRSFAAVGLSLICAQPCTAWAKAADQQATIAWDDAGVPHISAADDLAGFRAFGWAQMEAHADLILGLYGRARGRSAEYWGEAHVADDLITRTLGLPARTDRWLASLTPDERARLDAFVAGMNDYAKAHRDAISPDKRVVLPIQSSDPLGHIEQTIYGTFIAGFQIRAAQSAKLDPAPAQDDHPTGSNGYAVASARSADGHAMLVINPHLRWTGEFIWFEAKLDLPSQHFYGATLVGMPFLSIGFNEDGGWTNTVNQLDGADVYKLTLKDGGYLLDSRVQPIEVSHEAYKVRLASGRIETRSLTIERAIQGPILRREGNQALALKLVGDENLGMLQQYWDMAGARGIDAFEQVTSRLQIPYFNVIYADRSGQIYYLDGGRFPDRKLGDWSFWNGTIPGDRSEFLWRGSMPYSAVPHFRNPPGGFIQNANDAPWLTTWPPVLKPGDYSPTIAPMEPLGWRPQHALRQIMAKASISFDDLVAMTQSNTLEMADRILPDLLASTAASADPLIMKARSVLTAWDHTSDRNSKGSILFIDWATRMKERFGNAMFSTAWSAAHPVETPRGLADPAAAERVLRDVATALQARHGRLDLAYGDVVRLRMGQYDLPASGGPQALGSFRATLTRPEKDGTETVIGGNTFYAVVHFGERVKALGLLPYGNASQPGSPHIGDQLPAYSDSKLRPILFYADELKDHIRKVETVR